MCECLLASTRLSTHRSMHNRSPWIPAKNIKRTDKSLKTQSTLCPHVSLTLSHLPFQGRVCQQRRANRTTKKPAGWIRAVTPLSSQVTTHTAYPKRCATFLHAARDVAGYCAIHMCGMQSWQLHIFRCSTTLWA